MSVLLIAEHNNKELKAFTLNAVTAASQIDTDVHALVIGNNCTDVAKAASQLPLVKKVISIEAAHYEKEKFNEDELEKLFLNIKDKKISGDRKSVV